MQKTKNEKNEENKHLDTFDEKIATSEKKSDSPRLLIDITELGSMLKFLHPKQVDPDPNLYELLDICDTKQTTFL